MEAVVFENTGNWSIVPGLKEVDIDVPKQDEVQVKITARPINPSDEMFIQGVYRKRPVLPQVAGLEAAGIIVKCGDAVDRSLVGKQVVFRAAGTWAQFINIKRAEVKIVPAEIEPAVACQLSLNTLTAFALLEEIQLKKGQWLLLTAASGAVAKQLIQLAVSRDIKVIALVRNISDKDSLLRLGATAVISQQNDDLVSAVKALTSAGADAAIDAVGGSIGTSLYKMMAPFGKLIIYGRLSSDPVQYFNGDVIYRNLTVKGFGIDAWAGSKTADELDAVWNEIITAVLAGKLKIGYDQQFPLKNFGAAIERYKRTSEKVILV